MITVSELRRNRHYALLNDQEKLFLEQYIELSGDLLGAFKSAYNFSSSKTELQHLKKVSRKAIIASLLDWIDGDSDVPDKDKIVKLVWSAAKSATRPIDKIRGAEILSDLLDLGVTPKEPDPEDKRLQDIKEIEAFRMGMIQKAKEENK